MFRGSEESLHLLARGEGAADEPIGDRELFVTAEQHAIGRWQGPAGTTDLLVVSDD
jgi:hypothetical protein